MPLLSKILLFSWLIIALLSVGCKKQPNAANLPPGVPKASRVDFNYYSAKGRIKIDQGGQVQRANADMRMKKDSIVWISLRATAGIEGARVLISKDSVIILNRLSKEYYAYSFADLSNDLNLNLSLPMIQDIVLGNLFVIADRENTTTSRTEEFLTVLQMVNQLKVESKVNLANQKLTSVVVEDVTRKDKMSMDYTNFQAVNGKFLQARECLVKLEYADTTKMKNTQFELKYDAPEEGNEPLNFNFNVPDRYKRAYLGVKN